MNSLQELLKQRENPKAPIPQPRQEQAAVPGATCHRLIAEYELTEQDLFGARRGARPASIGSKVAPKYRNNETGETWTGRGKPPRWIQDKNREDFLIK